MKRFVSVLTGLLVALVVLILGATFLIDANHFRPGLESELTAALRRQVKLGDLKLSLISSSVTASDLSVADDPAFSPEPFLRAKSLSVSIEILPFLFSRKLNVTGLTIEEPEIALLQNIAGTWNFASLGAKSTAKAEPGGGLDLAVKIVKLSDGKFTLAKAATLEKVSLELRDFSPNSSFPFELSAHVHAGGEIKLKGKAGPINPGDSSGTPFEASLTLSQVALQAATGIASLNGAASSDGSIVQIQGRAKVEKLKLAPRGSPATREVEIDYTVRHDFQKHAGSLTAGQIHIGKATANLTGTYVVEDPAPVVHVKLAGDRMPLPELVAMLPALNIVLPAGSSIQGGTLGVQVAADGPVDRLASDGSVKIEKARLVAFDLGGRMSMIERLAGLKTGPDTQIELCDASVKSSPAGTTVEAVRLIAPAIGELTGSGSISPEHALDFRMHTTLHTSGAVMTALGVKGDTGIPFLIQGTAMNPVFKPDVKGMVSGRLKSLPDPTGLLQGLLKKKSK